MPVIFGDTLSHWIIRIVCAIFAFLLIMWLIPAWFNAISFPVPHNIVEVFAVLVALLILFANWVPGFTNKTPPAVV